MAEASGRITGARGYEVLGYRLIKGQGLQQHIEEGEQWLQKAAEAGEAIAMREWGKYLIHK